MLSDNSSTKLPERSTMRLADKRGEIAISADLAKQYVQSWFRPDDLITIVGRRSVPTGNFDTITQTIVAKEFLGHLDDDALREIVFDVDGSSWNVYVGICPVREELSIYRRGTKDNIAYVPGLWADIDIKPDSFNTEQDILDWLNSLALKPTMICGSGSGGIHAYWRAHWTEQFDENLVERWWSYLDEQAGEHRSIDKLIDTTRMLRLPGTVHFPKLTSSSSDASRKLGMVKIIELTGRTYGTQEVMSISEGAYLRRGERRKKLIGEDAQRRIDGGELAKSLLEENEIGVWKARKAIAYIEDIVNDTYSWDDILVPMGWTFMKQLRDGSNEWARPGRNERSAVCDFEGSPVMSLLSTSYETGLFDLKDTGIALSKYRVLLRLHFNDDINALLRTVIHKQKNILTQTEGEPYYV
jgi:hypothetical protein